MGVFDTETTGVDTEQDRIVTCFIGVMDGDGNLIEEWSWLLNPGVDIAEGASAVHGITNEVARAEGRTDLDVAIFEIASVLGKLDSENIPVAIYNAPYDLTLLDRELRRHCGYKEFRPPKHIIDPLVIDKAIDKYRRGSRKLSDTAAHYDIPVGNAHDAREDCIMTGRLALRLLTTPRLRDIPMDIIMSKQVYEKRQQAMSFRNYLVKKGEPEKAKGVSTAWPMKEFG